MGATAKASILALFSCILLGACGGGNGASGGAGTCSGIDVAGTWISTEVVDSSACGGETATQAGTYAITQDGCSVAVTAHGATFTGAIAGTHMSWTGSFPDGSGTTHITGMDLELSSARNSATGTASWTWSGSGTSCSGTTRITATRAEQSPSSAGGAEAYCSAMSRCQSLDQQTCEQIAPLALQLIPDPGLFGSCVQGLDCSEVYVNSPAVDACADLDPQATACQGSTLHACSKTNHLCIDENCATICGYVGLSFQGCASKFGHAACGCG